MNKKTGPPSPCECGYAPKAAKSRRLFLKSVHIHRYRGRCPLRPQNRPKPAILLSPKNGRFDSRAALDVLLSVWR